MANSSSLLNFWDSSEVSRLIKESLMGGEITGHPDEDRPWWRILQDQIVRLNTRGVFFHPPQVHIVQQCMIDELGLEPDDGSSTYIPFRRSIGVAADLLHLFRQKVEKAHGRECWQRTAMLFEDEPRSSLLFGLLRDVSAAPRSEAVDILERVSRKGLRLDQLGITRARFRSRDCGVEALVRISTKMLFFLQYLKPADPAPATAPTPVETSRVIVDALTTNIVTLRHKGKEAKLSGRNKELFTALFWAKSKMVTYENLWELLIGRKSGKAYRQDLKGGGPPALLRKIKSKLHQKLAKRLGQPPVGEFWVEAVEHEGYQLNHASLIWQKAMDALDRPNELPIDPGQADRRSSKGYRR